MGMSFFNPGRESGESIFPLPRLKKGHKKLQKILNETEFNFFLHVSGLAYISMEPSSLISHILFQNCILRLKIHIIFSQK